MNCQSCFAKRNAMMTFIVDMLTLRLQRRLHCRNLRLRGVQASGNSVLPARPGSAFAPSRPGAAASPSVASTTQHLSLRGIRGRLGGASASSGGAATTTAHPLPRTAPPPRPFPAALTGAAAQPLAHSLARSSGVRDSGSVASSLEHDYSVRTDTGGRIRVIARTPNAGSSGHGNGADLQTQGEADIDDEADEEDAFAGAVAADDTWMYQESSVEGGVRSESEDAATSRQLMTDSQLAAAAVLDDTWPPHGAARTATDDGAESALRGEEGVALAALPEEQPGGARSAESAGSPRGATACLQPHGNGASSEAGSNEALEERDGVGGSPARDAPRSVPQHAHAASPPASSVGTRDASVGRDHASMYADAAASSHMDKDAAEAPVPLLELGKVQLQPTAALGDHGAHSAAAGERSVSPDAKLTQRNAGVSMPAHSRMAAAAAHPDAHASTHEAAQLDPLTGLLSGAAPEAADATAHSDGTSYRQAAAQIAEMRSQHAGKKLQTGSYVLNADGEYVRRSAVEEER